ncbi:hypothetical protein E2562_033757 [Oryza meyeriana var. granulata]|uniref:Uncharacterized protein n=1 Tax=Oryza meyeriana var. granulata TaxID=110450 RepID=A0A6G1F139_9ORYZ|nr:hypothetical protein E2562_033757 [Oryza meyeriana var. granulata]
MTSMRAVRSTLASIRAATELARQEVLRRELAECHLVAGIWCHGFTVVQLLSIRANLPQTARLVVAKNSASSCVVENAVGEGHAWCRLALEESESFGNERVVLETLKTESCRSWRDGRAGSSWLRGVRPLAVK